MLTLVDRNEYKRRQAPPGIRVTRRAFGRDRRYPLTSGYGRNDDWLDGWLLVSAGLSEAVDDGPTAQTLIARQHGREIGHIVGHHAELPLCGSAGHRREYHHFNAGLPQALGNGRCRGPYRASSEE